MDQDEVIKRLRQIADILQNAQDHVETASNTIQSNRESLYQADGSTELLSAIDAYLEASHILQNLGNRLKTRLDPTLAQAGEFQVLLTRLEDFRKAHTRYQTSFDDLWTLSIPFQVRAILHKQGTNQDEVWQKRWGENGFRRAKIAIRESPELKPKEVEEREILLTLRYARYPGPGYTTYQEISRILNISSTLIFNRFLATEKAIITQLLRQQASEADLVITSDDESSDKTMKSGQGPSRSSADRNVWLLNLRNGEKRYRIAIQVLMPDKGDDETTSPFLTIEQVKKLEIVVAAIYLMGEDKFIFIPVADLPDDSAALLSSEEISTLGRDDLRSALSQI